MYSGYQDPESDKNFDFNDDSIRRGFIKKVYSILCVSSLWRKQLKSMSLIKFSKQLQLTITLGFISLFTFHNPTKLWVKQHPEMVWISFGILLVTMISMACCESVRRKSPMNFIFLGLFTLAQSFVLGTVSSRYTGEEIFLAVGITAAVCLALTIFAFQTKIDFTVMGGEKRKLILCFTFHNAFFKGVLFVAVIILMLFGLIAMFFPGKTITLVYASCGALLFSIYLVYDTQVISRSWIMFASQ